MSPVWRVFKKVLFWSYGRTTWQYDVLCALILAFVFLTPKSWFQSELGSHLTHQSGSTSAASSVLLAWPGADPTGTSPDAQEIERRLRIATGRPDARVKGLTEVRDSDGRLVAYKVDIE